MKNSNPMAQLEIPLCVNKCNEVKKKITLVYGKHYFAFWNRKVQYKGFFFTDLMKCDTG